MHLVFNLTSQLEDTSKQLSIQWQFVREIGDDAARRDFEERYSMEFEVVTEESIAHLQGLVQVAEQSESKLS